MNNFGHIYILFLLGVFSVTHLPNFNWILFSCWVSGSHVSQEPPERWQKGILCYIGPGVLLPGLFPSWVGVGVWSFNSTRRWIIYLYSIWKKTLRWILITRGPGSKQVSLSDLFPNEAGGWNPDLTPSCFPALLSSWGADEKSAGLYCLVRSDF